MESTRAKEDTDVEAVISSKFTPGLFATISHKPATTIVHNVPAESNPSKPLKIDTDLICFAEVSPQDSSAPDDSRVSAVLAFSSSSVRAWILKDSEFREAAVSLPRTFDRFAAVASAKDVVSVITGDSATTLQILRVRLNCSPTASSLAVSFEEINHAIDLGSPCTGISVSELAVWVACGNRLLTFKLRDPSCHCSADVCPSNPGLRVTKVIGLCCLCVVSSSAGEVFLASLRCCDSARKDGSTAPLLSVAQVSLIRPVAALDAFQSTLLLVDGNRRGVTFACMSEARSRLLTVTCCCDCPEAGPSSTKVSVVPKVATVAESDVTDVAILSPRSAIFLCGSRDLVLTRFGCC